MGHDEMRFSDEKLNRFYQDFKQHVDLVDKHIADFKDHVENEKLLIERIADGQEANTRAIESLAKNTSDLVEAWNGAQSVVKMGSLLGKFGKWLTGLAFLGVAFKWLIDNWA